MQLVRPTSIYPRAQRWAALRPRRARLIIAAALISLSLAWMHAGALAYECTSTTLSSPTYLVAAVVMGLIALHVNMYAFAFDPRGRKLRSVYAVLVSACMLTASLVAAHLALDEIEHTRVAASTTAAAPGAPVLALGVLGSTTEAPTGLRKWWRAQTGRAIAKRMQRRVRRLFTEGPSVTSAPRYKPVPTAVVMAFLVLLTAGLGYLTFVLSCELACAGRENLSVLVLLAGGALIGCLWLGILSKHYENKRSYYGDERPVRRRRR